MAVENNPPSEVAAFYRGRSVLVTGGTGFMGKVLVEKLLYTCDDIERIYVVARGKREKGPQSRLDDILKLPLFQRLRKEFPERLKRLVFLPGDIQQENLGLSAEDADRVRRDVSVVFHCAATLRLEAKLKDAVRMNLLGTWNVLQLAKTLSDLQVMVHLSTAFCHCDMPVLEEKMYPCSINPHDIMRIAQWMDDSAIEMITPKLIHPHPNTYTFTKRLAEELINEHYPQLPLVIARPSIVTPAWKEPMPGWVDSLNGPVGLMVAAGKGVVRSMHCRGDLYSEVIPVDIAISGLVTIAAKEATRLGREKGELPVYNVTASAVKKITWGDVLEKGRRIIYDYPFEMTVWYPDGNIRSSKLVHNLCVIFLHFLPAYFIDLLMFIFRQKRFMVRLQHRIHDGLEVLQYFTTRQWVFRSDLFMSLYPQLNETDRRLFDMNMAAVDDDEYMLDSCLGARQYCLKEDLKSLPRCRRNLRLLYVVDRVWSVVFYLGLLWLLFSWSDTARHLMDAVGDRVRSLPVIRSVIDRESSPYQPL